ncbi:MAG: hypothetical protein KJ572_09085 [Gammaproteobacteria bacterium]|nr:hypothetical protein [Sideroxydans sp.]MBU3903550.1 hypothetical protein [Gammaproteobacteria bacterium]MBU4046488.1 hypothetical protein [Gammaproteobacteria bacterium]
MSKKRAAMFRSLRAKHRQQAMIVGVVGYTAETWAQVKATATDPQCFEETFERWKDVAVSARREFQRSGVQAVEYQIEPQVFAAWCVQQQQQNDAKARAEFVSEKLGELYGQSA